MLGAVLSAAYEKNIAETASHFTGSAKDALESSLAVAMAVAEKLGPAADDVTNAAMNAFMTGISQASLAAAAIIFLSAMIALFGLAKHAQKDDDTI